MMNSKLSAAITLLVLFGVAATLAKKPFKNHQNNIQEEGSYDNNMGLGMVAGNSMEYVDESQPRGNGHGRGRKLGHAKNKHNMGRGNGPPHRGDNTPSPVFDPNAPIFYGSNIGTNMGQNAGTNVWPNVGPNVGQSPGTTVWPNGGTNVGQNVGPNVGSNAGTNVGQNPGTTVWPNVGTNVGQNVGPNVGSNVWPNAETNVAPTAGTNPMDLGTNVNTITAGNNPQVFAPTFQTPADPVTPKLDERFGVLELAPKCQPGYVLAGQRCRKLA